MQTNSGLFPETSKVKTNSNCMIHTWFLRLEREQETPGMDTDNFKNFGFAKLQLSG